ncbi:MAG TPA: hypothetical protein VMU81_06820 [Acetobacteraceae bacterium]|nr:hypothetical protein [Acetobacteraceae bacterium]
MPRCELFADMGEPTEAGVQGVEKTGIDAMLPEVESTWFCCSITATNGCSMSH